eukprot:TRINITY_DN1004_c0_g1_i1.p1 TRINITY_DN1004_c0_g1~~TRINITY_DN1004_c0_g1_i1.p1  ORF type:complete len:217 (+),score=52.82 TRINITY_DN1004_c0_g1_i1:54-704(+)
MGEVYDKLFKIVLAGDSSVGKTNLLLRLSKNEFNPSSRSTVGVEFSNKTFSIKNQVVKAQIWDTAGQDRFKSLTAAYYRGAVGALLVYDVTNASTFEDIEKWAQEIREYAKPGAVIMLVGNKVDLEEDRVISTHAGRECAQKNAFFFMETSALNGLNVEKAFAELILQVSQRNEAEDADSDVQDLTLPFKGVAPPSSSTVKLNREPNTTPNSSSCC